MRLLPGDDPFQYQTEPHPYSIGAIMLAHKDNGDCIYLGDTGCTIHDRKPRQCLEMDCRIIAASVSFTQMRKLSRRDYRMLRVWRKGKELAKHE